MKFCQNCGKELLDEAVICPGCGCQVKSSDDSVNAGFVVLSVFIPLFGIIYWPLNTKTHHKTAQACGIAAIISWAISAIVSAVYFAILFQ